MSALEAGIDRTNNGEHIAIVMGHVDAINANSKVLEKFRHMTSLSYEQKRDILSRLKFDGEILVFCVNYGMPELIALAQARLSELKVRKHIRISDSIGTEMRQSIQTMFGEFIVRNGTTLPEIAFEVDDPDVIEYLRKGGLSFKKPGLAHKLADCVAHANGKHWFVAGNVRHPPGRFRQDFHRRVLDRIYR